MEVVFHRHNTGVRAVYVKHQVVRRIAQREWRINSHQCPPASLVGIRLSSMISWLRLSWTATRDFLSSVRNHSPCLYENVERRRLKVASLLKPLFRCHLRKHRVILSSSIGILGICSSGIQGRGAGQLVSDAKTKNSHRKVYSIKVIITSFALYGRSEETRLCYFNSS